VSAGGWICVIYRLAAVVNCNDYSENIGFSGSIGCADIMDYSAEVVALLEVPSANAAMQAESLDGSRFA